MVTEAKLTQNFIKTKLYFSICVSKRINGDHFADEKEEEIQIGFPTDVKHVAHIGSDDPSANAPSWVLFSFFAIYVSHLLTN